MTNHNTINKLILFFHTIFYLKPIQIIGRVWFKYYRPFINLKPAPARRIINQLWQRPCTYIISQPQAFVFQFLNETHAIKSVDDWNHQEWQKLWLYNLHYFADLNAENAGTRQQWQRQLIDRWITENPPGLGNGWEPYPLSLRIVNWIKWSLQGNLFEQHWQHSLAVQTRYLSQRIEWHLLGNHLLANGKALIFAGCYFSGPEAQRWLDKGWKILRQQLDEQILADGGHFERSPMYHSVILEDLLDLFNLTRTYPECSEQRIDFEDIIQRMRHCLQTLTHADGDIAFFNDAALNIACPPATLEDYAKRLGLAPLKPQHRALSVLADSGYLRLQSGPALVLLDVAPIGPDYLPGHAHADTLSFELSLSGRRVLVNSGTSCYGISQQRQYERSTAAHNTVVIDNCDSSEVWSGFRVARRARPSGLTFNENKDEIVVECAHNGYQRLPGRPLHRRRWSLQKNALIITDSIDGSFDTASAYFHFHPDFELSMVSDAVSGELLLANQQHFLRWQVQQGEARIIDSSYHPEFGLSQDNQCLRVDFSGTELITSFFW